MQSNKPHLFLFCVTFFSVSGRFKAIPRRVFLFFSPCRAPLIWPDISSEKQGNNASLNERETWVTKRKKKRVKSIWLYLFVFLFYISCLNLHSNISNKQNARKGILTVFHFNAGFVIFPYKGLQWCCFAISHTSIITRLTQWSRAWETCSTKTLAVYVHRGVAF